MASTWPREALEQLGRPLNKWDLCPTCGRPAAEHYYNRLTLAELICPVANIEEQVRRNEERDRARMMDRARLNDTAKRRPDALAGPRAYFDDDE